jgi:hypothetical protein
MSISVVIVGSARRTASGPDLAVQKRATCPSSIKYAAVVAAGVALFGMPSPANAAAQRNGLNSVSSASASSPAAEGGSDAHVSISGQDSARDLMSHLPWLAPVGHRQPRRADVPPEKSSSDRDRLQERPNAKIDQKLIICPC